MVKIAMMLLLVFWLFISPAHGEPPTVEQVKEAFIKAIVASGYKVGDTTNEVIEREAPRIAATLEDMEGVRIVVDKVNDLEHGFCYALYPNDQVQRMGYYAEGDRVGPWRFYYPDGTLATKVQYNNDGEEIGQHVAYLRNGNVHYVETYVDGVKHGPKTTFYEDGGTHMHQMWQNGQMHGFSIIYYPTGVMKKFASWANGLQHGTVLLYDESGQLTEQSEFVNGQKQ